MKNWLPRHSTTAWRRDTIASGSTRSLLGSRPIESTVLGRTISRFCEELGLTTSFAITPRDLASAEGLLEGDLHLDLHPLFQRGGILPLADRLDHGVVDHGAGRLQHLGIVNVAVLVHNEAHG